MSDSKKRKRNVRLRQILATQSLLLHSVFNITESTDSLLPILLDSKTPRNIESKVISFPVGRGKGYRLPIVPNILRPKYIDLVEDPDHFETLTRLRPKHFQILVTELSEFIIRPRNVRGVYSDYENSLRKARSCKLSIEDRLLCYLYRMRGDQYLADLWSDFSWDKSSIDDDFYHINEIIVRAGARAQGYEDVKIPGLRVEWPNEEERRELAQDPIFPGCIGVLDATHTTIQRPKEDQHLDYRGDQGEHTRLHNVVVTKDGKFSYSNPNHRGHTADLTGWQITSIAENPKEYFSPGQFLLVDLGYEESRYLHTPYPEDELGDDIYLQELNRLHRGCRVIVEWAIGAVKRNFHLLQGPYRLDNDRLGEVWTAAIFLTNWLFHLKGPLRPKPWTGTEDVVTEWDGWMFQPE